MTIDKSILLFSFFVCSTTIVYPQAIERFNTFSYSVNEGLLQSSMIDMAIDKNNFCWLSFPNGIQKFDGKDFTTVSVQPGLPDDKSVKFFRSSTGNLLVSHSQGISRYDINHNRFEIIYRQTGANTTPAYFLGEDENVIFFYGSESVITGIDARSFKKVSVVNAAFRDYLHNGHRYITPSENIINHRIAMLIDSSLWLWDLKKKKILFRTAPVQGILNWFLLLHTADEVLYYTNGPDKSLRLYNFATGKDSLILQKKSRRTATPFRSIVYPWRGKTLFSFFNNLYETNASLQTIRSELVNFQNEPVAGTSSIARIREDNYGNLFLATVMGGIKKVIRSNYAIKYYSTAVKEDNFILSILPDKKNNRILMGTSGNGLLVFDTLQHFVKHIKSLPGKETGFSITAMLKKRNGDYLLYAWGEKAVWRLSHDFTKLDRIALTGSLPGNESGISYFSNFLYQNEKEAVIQSQGCYYRYNFATNTVTENKVLPEYPLGSLRYDSVIITHMGDSLIYLHPVSFTRLKSISFKNTGGVRCFTRDGNNIYIGSNKGVFRIDGNGNILQQMNRQTGLPDECIYAMTVDKNGFLWCSTNKGIVRINKDNSLLQLTKEDGLQENEFNTNAVAVTEDGEIFFGGVNGVSSFYPAGIGSFEDKPRVLLTGLKVNNEDYIGGTAPWMIDRIAQPYYKNSFSFDFIATGANNPGQYIYQYRMQGIDKDWIQNNDMQTVRYFLPPGKYIFKLYASRFFNKEAEPLKEIVIIIHPPFWRTWWFMGGLAALLLIAITYVVNQYNRRKYRKKLMMLENEQALKLERERISRDLHDSIGAYANAVLYKTDLLQHEKDTDERNELMNDLKFASKDIITSLRETIWALKKEEYTAEECLLRIRNFIQPFNRYYSHIRFVVHGEAPAGMRLHSTRALNLVRMVQESVSNAIKHAQATEISITSEMDRAKWKLSVSDNGKGFDHISIDEQQQGNGLANLKQRAGDAGLGLSVESGPDKGTLISIWV